MAFCSNCGCQVENGVRFCANCGAPIQINQNASVYEPDDVYEEEYSEMAYEEPANASWQDRVKQIPDKYKKKKSKWTLLIVVVLVLFLVTSGVKSSRDKAKEKQRERELATSLETIAALQDMLTSPMQETSIEPFEESVTVVDESVEPASEPSSKIEAVKATPTPKPTSTPEPTPKPTSDMTPEPTPEATPTPKLDGVNPELKAFMDSYEKFVDEYVAFMKRYSSDSGNALTMMTDYLKIMARYEEFATKLDKYDESTMSNADLAYYLEVTNRCTQKMLNVY